MMDGVLQLMAVRRIHSGSGGIVLAGRKNSCFGIIQSNARRCVGRRSVLFVCLGVIGEINWVGDLQLGLWALLVVVILVLVDLEWRWGARTSAAAAREVLHGQEQRAQISLHFRYVFWCDGQFEMHRMNETIEDRRDQKLPSNLLAHFRRRL